MSSFSHSTTRAPFIHHSTVTRCQHMGSLGSEICGLFKNADDYLSQATWPSPSAQCSVTRWIGPWMKSGIGLHVWVWALNCHSLHVSHIHHVQTLHIVVHWRNVKCKIWSEGRLSSVYNVHSECLCIVFFLHSAKWIFCQREMFRQMDIVCIVHSECVCKRKCSDKCALCAAAALSLPLPPMWESHSRQQGWAQFNFPSLLSTLLPFHSNSTLIVKTLRNGFVRKPILGWWWKKFGLPVLL